MTEEEITERAAISGEGNDAPWDEFVQTLIGASCAFFAQEVLSGPPEHPYNGRFLIGEHHEEWNSLVVKHDRICVLAPRDHGKCAVGSSLVQAADGRRVRLDQWQGGDVLALDVETHKLVRDYAPPSRPNGTKRVLRVTTRSGRRVTVTENHPLRLLEGWKHAEELQVGQRIAVPYRLPWLGTGVVEDAWLLGLLMGDGGLTGSNVVLSTGDGAVISAVEALGVRAVHAGNFDYRLPGLQERMRQVGMWGKTAHEKRVPESIYQAADDSIAEFVAGFLDADAHVNFRGGGSVEFYSVSEDMLRDVQSLLVRLGVLAVLTEKRGRYQGQPHPSWRLTVRGKDILRLAAVVRPRGARAAQLTELAQEQESRGPCSGKALDLFPVEVWSMVEHSEDWFRQRGYPRPNPAYEPTREKLRAVAQAEGNVRLLALTEANVLWDEVTDIEDMGEQETWSLHVARHANYVADDIINHNTFFWNFAFPLWKAVTHPGGIGFIFSATSPQAERILGDIKNELESNPKLAWLVPSRKEQWSSTSIKLANGHRIYARGFGTKVRGAHPNWIVVDDALNDETAYSETVRKKQVDYFFTAITNMCVPGGQIAVVGTPFHTDDLYGELEKNPEYEFRRYQAWDEKTQRPLWRDRYDQKRLEARKREIGSIRFAREFLCVPVADDMSLFPSYLFQGQPTEQFTVKLGMPKAFWDELGVQAYMGVDFAMSSSVNADYTVVWTMGTDKLGNRWIMDIQRAQGMAYQKQLSLIVAVARRYNPALVFLEANQMQRIFGDELIRTTDLPIKKFVTGVQKNTLDKGVPSLRVLLENGKFRIPRGDQRSIELTDLWIKEMHNFTYANGKLQSVGGHDDTVMACWIADQAIRQGGFSFTFEDEGKDGKTLDEYLKEQTAEPDMAPTNVSPIADGEEAGSMATGNLFDDGDSPSGLPLPSFFRDM